MEPDRSSRVAARRIVEEVLADHAARATALDGATPVTIVERPDTPSWRAARRIVEETLAEHAGRAVVPPAMRVDLVVDLEEQDVEVVVDLDGHERATQPRSGQVASAEEEEEAEPGVVSIVAPIERDETPAKATRRIVEGMLTDHDIDPDPPPDAHDVPVAFEVDPVPGALPEPPDPITTGEHAAGVAAAAEPSETLDPDGPAGPADPDDPDHRDDVGPTEAASGEAASGPAGGEDEPTEADESPASNGMDEKVLSVDELRLRAAIPEQLFAPDPEPTDIDTPLDEPSAVDVPGIAPSVDGPPPPPRPLEAGPPARPDPDAPVTIAARIVADVLADRERAAEETHDAELAALEAEIDGSEPPDEAAARAQDAQPDTGPAASEGPEAQPSVRPEGWAVVPGATDRIGPGSPSGVMIVDAGVEDPPVPDPVASDARPQALPAKATDEVWMAQEAVVPETEDEFGGWPEPIAPPRRTGRWLITTVLGAVLLALLLPLAIGALRDLVSFS